MNPWAVSDPTQVFSIDDRSVDVTVVSRIKMNSKCKNTIMFDQIQQNTSKLVLHLGNSLEYTFIPQRREVIL